jgi:hypothetical protein
MNNHRRAELIRKKHREGLTLVESDELARLDKELEEDQLRRFPAPSLHEAELDAIEARLANGDKQSYEGVD